MKVTKVVEVISEGMYSTSQEWDLVQSEVVEATEKIEWPIGSGKFSINPQKKGNGVGPIKTRFLKELEKLSDWTTELQGSRLPSQFDAIRKIDNGNGLIGVEWETGNISSSHRSINRILLAIHQGIVEGGILLVPSRDLYNFLTDRIGNFNELEQYIELWQKYLFKSAIFQIIVFEQDEINNNVPLIPKGKDGNAPKS